MQKNLKIGLETHIQINVPSKKLFCNCNIGSTCEICTGQPGTMPQKIKPEITRIIGRIVHILKLEPAKELVFDRKHYIYRDLPKSYQITQKNHPFGTRGHLICEADKYPIDVVILQQDPAKTDQFGGVDYGRCGTPLLEIVTPPVFKNSEEVGKYLKNLAVLMESENIVDIKQPGAMRTDVNISCNNHARVEVKNVTGIDDVIAVIQYEIKRQSSTTPSDIIHTRAWDSIMQQTTFSRKKESDSQYMYMREYDIIPVSMPKPIAGPTIFQKRAQVLESGVSKSCAWTIAKHCYLYKIFNKLRGNNFQMLSDSLLRLHAQVAYRGYARVEKKLNSSEILELVSAAASKEIGQIAYVSRIRAYFDGRKKSETKKSLNQIIRGISQKNLKFKSVIRAIKPGDKRINYLIGQVLKITREYEISEILKILLSIKLGTQE